MWTLETINGEPVKIGETIFNRHGIRHTLKGGSPPHKPSSTGRVYVQRNGDKSQREYFPQVFHLIWRETNG